MTDLLCVILYSSVAGLPIIAGASVSRLVQKRVHGPDTPFNRWVVAFGGGALTSAVAFALVPRALEILPSVPLAVLFLAGVLGFMGIDIAVAHAGASLSQVLSMMMDFLPEALALGASFAHDHRFGLLLALFIGLQNLPEGFNSYVELSRTGGGRRALWILFALSFVGIAAAVLGFFVLADRPAAIAGIMLVAAGGIIYMIFKDIAPLAGKKGDWIPSTGAGIGFLLGMLGEKIIL